MAESNWSDIESVPVFLDSPDWEDVIGDLNRTQLLLIAEYLGLTIPEGCKKGSLLLLIVKAVQESEEGLSSLTRADEEAKLLEKQIMMHRLEVEKLQLLAVEKEKDRVREREREAHELRVLDLRQQNRDEGFNASNALKLVPVFDESNVAEFFVAFEKVANKLAWPKNMWTTLIQCRFVGKAQRVYVTLDEDLSADYDSVKPIILKAYKLVPEAYRQKFRDLRKFPAQTYVEFARLKEQAFSEWVKSKEITDFKKLKELILVEEFKNCVHRELKVHLEELKFDTLQEVAIASDEYVLSHKSFNRTWNKNFQGNESDSSKVKNVSAVSSSISKSPSMGRKSPSRSGKSDIVCYFCRQKGHVRSNCNAWKKYLEKNKKPVGLLSGRNLHRTSDKCSSVLEKFKDYIIDGEIYADDRKGQGKKVCILRDTGAAQSLILRSSLPFEFVESLCEFVLLGGFPNTVSAYPLENLFLESKVFKGTVKLAVVDVLPIEGIDVIMANDLAAGKVEFYPILSSSGREKEPLKAVVEAPVSVITRSRAREVDLQEVDLDLGRFDQVHIKPLSRSEVSLSQKGTDMGWDRESLMNAQKEEFKLVNDDVNVDDDVKDLTKPIMKWEDGLLCRFSRPLNAPADSVEAHKQIVVPEKYREKLLFLSHEDILAGHFGVKKTFNKLAENFYWPKMKTDVKRHVGSCVTCQVTGKPNQKIPKAPLVPIPSVGEPFAEVLIDIVGPLPRTTSGHEYLLTIMDRMSKYPEAIPLRSIKSVKVVEALIGFFTKFGLPRVLQSDCGSNFVSKYFGDKMKELRINHVTSSPYHPESQGQVERFHQTLKSMIKKYCLAHGSEWDKEIPYLLFSFRSAPSEILNYSPFQLVFGHNVRGPLEVVRECWEGEKAKVNLLDYVTGFHEKMLKAWKYSLDNLKKGQEKMKLNFDRNTKSRTFEVGDEVLVLLPFPGNPLKASFSGPWKVIKRVNELNYLVETPNRRKKHQLCHINMLKPFVKRRAVTEPISIVENVGLENDVGEVCSDWPGTNPEVLDNLDEMLQHLDETKRNSLINIIKEFPEIFKDTPGRTSVLKHDVDVGEAYPIKQRPYRLNPFKNEVVKKEVEYMLKNDLIEASSSPWSSPVVLVKKDENKFRLCFDYRKVNSVTKTDSYPLPRVDDSIDKIGSAKFISKFDLLKGYWQVGLTSRAKAISAFVTSDALYECKVMPFGMKNAAATFQRLMNKITNSLEGCVVYIDDLIIFSDDWPTHLERIKELFKVLREAGLVVNLQKCDFSKAKIIYLGHEIGFGNISPKNANVQSVLEFPTPRNRREVRRFLGMVGYYRRFIKNFSDVSEPLTNLLRKGVRFAWNDMCTDSFEKLKSVLINFPVLKSPDFSSPFQLAVDASDTGVGAILTQLDEEGKSLPVAYFSKKLSPAQKKYSTIEKEALSLVLAINHFEVYLSSSLTPIKVWTDHNPLLFLNKFRNKNQRLMRWSLILQEWDLDINHIAGKHNVIPDALSRI